MNDVGGVASQLSNFTTPDARENEWTKAYKILRQQLFAFNCRVKIFFFIVNYDFRYQSDEWIVFALGTSSIQTIICHMIIFLPLEISPMETWVRTQKRHCFAVLNLINLIGR